MKIKIGKEKNPRRPFDLSHDVHTTLEWGFMQPTCKLEMIADSTINCNIGSACRLVPLVAPTFGRATVKHYAYFVPIRQVCMQYENLLTRTGYNGSSVTYIPTKVLSAQLNILCSMLLSPSACHTAIFSANKSIVSQTNVASYSNLQDAEANRANALSLLYNELGFGSAGFDVRNTTLGNRPITIAGADYVLDCGANNNYVVAVRLNNYGRRLRKILLGLGYQINFRENISVSVLPLLAYYKAWFDLFAIKQKVNWQYTTAFKIIQTSAQQNVTTINTFPPLWKSFVDELANCYYTFNVDFFTAHQYELNYMMQNPSLSWVDTYDSDGTVENSGMGANSDSIWSNNSNNDGYLNPWMVKGLLKFLPFINKDSVLGQRVSKLLNVHGHGQADDDKQSHFIGASSVNIDISDVMSTAETAASDGTGEALGAYVGKGIGSGKSGNMKYSTNCPGFFIVLTTVVPRTGYCQGIDPCLFHGTRDVFDWYTSQFDAFGMQVTSGMSFLAASDYFRKTQASRQTNFGVMPRYSEYKAAAAAQNIVNGDISLRSRRTELLPYTLDRFINTSDITVRYSSDGVTESGFVVNETFVPSVNESLRYLGKTDLFGNFNRIFQTLGEENYTAAEKGYPEFDGFILHNVFDIKLVAPMKTLAESYDTDEHENAVSVDKA